MQQEPAADKVDDRTAESEHQFPDEYQPDESDIPVGNTDIDDGLGEERQDELQQAAGNQSEDDLGKIPPVRPGIAREETEGMYFLLGVLLQPVELRGRLEEQGNALLFTSGNRTHPVLRKLLPAVLDQSFPRISDIELPVMPDLVEDDEVVLVPVEDAGQG